ncbi:MAG: hypothetical protein L0Y73_03520 [Candidatus Aminicenantes bacterium]|nr:hypothetical protein [Candidatus Aminicenantes bacterium]
MPVDVRVVETKKDLKRFVKLPFMVFRDNPYWVPQLIKEDLEIFNRKKNPAYNSAETKLFLAYKNGKPVGRIAGILSHAANRKYKTKNLRFGWFDTIEDYEVADSLFNAVENWGKELGLATITGPHGFTDLDPEGMLVEGFDQLPTIAVYYNHPYYPVFTDRYGFKKEVDYLEFKAVPPNEKTMPDKLLRIGEKIKERSSIKILKFKSKKELKPVIGKVFKLIDEAFEEIYGSVPITEQQMSYYVKKFFPMVDKDLLQVAVNDKGEPVGFMLALPSLSKGFQKAKGRLFPFGWYHILKAVKGKNDVVDFYLAGIKKKYRGLGIDLLMVLETTKETMRRKIATVESNPELENNQKIQAQWKYFNTTNHKRRRIYKKEIGK